MLLRELSMPFFYTYFRADSENSNENIKFQINSFVICSLIFTRFFDLFTKFSNFHYQMQVNHLSFLTVVQLSLIR